MDVHRSIFRKLVTYVYTTSAWNNENRAKAA